MTSHHETNGPNTTDASNGLNGICRVINASLSPTPDLERSLSQQSPMGIRQTAITFLILSLFAVAKERKLSDPLVGTVDQIGRVILHVYDAGEGGKRPAPLTSDFGVVMCRFDGWVLFALGDRARKSVQEFTNYDRFLEALDTVPKGSTITIYDRCLMPQFYDFYPVHVELYDKFAAECKERGLTLAKDPNITCTCKDYEPEPIPKK